MTDTTVAATSFRAARQILFTVASATFDFINAALSCLRVCVSYDL
jgi:hypothetical protein